MKKTKDVFIPVGCDSLECRHNGNEFKNVGYGYCCVTGGLRINKKHVCHCYNKNYGV